MLEKDLDIVAITENWLSSQGQNDATIKQLCLPGYTFIHNPRQSRGGGVGLLYKSSLTVEQNNVDTYKSFETLKVTVKQKGKSAILFVIYRPPPTKEKQTATSQFYNEFSNLVDSCILESKQLIFAGDFNFHMDNLANSSTQAFNRILLSNSLKQHIVSPTHLKKHILDLVITREDDTIITTANVNNTPSFKSDHFWVHCELNIAKPPLPTKTVSYRKMKAIDLEQFSKDVTCSNLTNIDNFTCPDDVVNAYNSVLRELLNKHAPMKKKTITIHPKNPWYNADIASAKRASRRAERKWRKTGLMIHKQLYIVAHENVHKLIDRAKRKYYLEKIKEAPDQKTLFKIVDDLLQVDQNAKLPKYDSSEELANRFSDFLYKRSPKFMIN